MLQDMQQSRVFVSLREHLNGIRIPLQPCLCIDEEPRDRLTGCTEHPTNC